MSKEKQIQKYESKQLIDELSKMPPMVIATAYLHAINYTLYGEDVTEKWLTATQNTSALEKAYNKGYEDRDSNLQEMYEKGLNDNKNELLDYVTESIEAEKKMIGSCHDLASEDYHKGVIYAFECMKMKLM